MRYTSSLDGLTSKIIETVAKLTGTVILADTTLLSVGIDSISATEFSTSLSKSLDTELPSTLLFDYPSLRSIAGSLQC